MVVFLSCMLIISCENQPGRLSLCFHIVYNLYVHLFAYHLDLHIIHVCTFFVSKVEACGRAITCRTEEKEEAHFMPFDA